MTVRAATPTDADACHLLQSLLPSPWPGLLSLAIHGDGARCLVAVGEEGVRGYVLALDAPVEERPSDGPPGAAIPDSCHVVELVVAPRARRQGVGTRLLDRVAATTDRDRLTLTVRADDADARAFYDALGFAVVERLEDFYEVDGRVEDGLLLTR